MKTSINLLKNTFTILCMYITLLICNTSNAQNIGINSTGATPDASAALDIVNANKGLLIPRVALTAVNSASPVTSPATSLLVYNTATAGTIPNNVTPGYYFWNGTAWLKFSAGNTSTDIEDDLRVVIDKGSNSAQLGGLTGITGPEIWFFRDNAGVDAMSFTIQMPHNWKVGTVIHPHIHWTPRSSAAGNVQWNLDYTWATYDAVTPATFPAITTTSVVATGPFTANQHLLTPLTIGDVGINGTGKAVSTILIGRIWRDSSLAADTYAADAGGLSIDFHISILNQFSE